MISQQTTSDAIVLSAKSNTGASRRYELLPDQGVFAGSSANCGLQLPGSDIADIHCRVGFEDGKLYVQNWMSSEGIVINGTPISSKTEVRIGDLIQIGSHEITVESYSTSRQERSKATYRRESELIDHESLEPEISATDVDDDGGVEAFRHAETDGASIDTDPPVEQCDTDINDGPDPLASMQFDDLMQVDEDIFSFEEEETYDHETVALLRAEIEDLQAALAQRDADAQMLQQPETKDPADDQASDELLLRMQELVDEANRSDERVAILEEMLHSSEAANRAEQEERHQLEAWVGDIEHRLGQREEEHAAEIDALRKRLEQSDEQQGQLQKRIQQAAFSGSAPKQYEETLENLQSSLKELQEQLADSEKHRLAAEQRLEQMSGEQDRALREERATIAKERAKVSRLRFELSSKLSEIESLPKAENPADRETAHRIQTLRQHLREIHEQEKLEEKDAPLTARLAKLWKRVEY